MILFILLSMIIMMIPTIMLMLNMIISKKMMSNMEKSSPFECGFDPLIPNRQPFSIQFFLISMMFLIFDIEIILLLPLIKLMKMFSLFNILLSFIFIFTLLIGLYIEYMEKSIEWKI